LPKLSPPGAAAGRQALPRLAASKGGLPGRFGQVPAASDQGLNACFKLVSSCQKDIYI
jgi:hypothetical protein